MSRIREVRIRHPGIVLARVGPFPEPEDLTRRAETAQEPFSPQPATHPLDDAETASGDGMPSQDEASGGQ